MSQPEDFIDSEMAAKREKINELRDELQKETEANQNFKQVAEPEA